MFNIGFSEMLVIVVFALIFLGPKQLPQVARAIGKVIGEFKRATDGVSTSFLKFQEEGEKTAGEIRDDFRIDPVAEEKPISDPETLSDSAAYSSQLTFEEAVPIPRRKYPREESQFVEPEQMTFCLDGEPIISNVEASPKTIEKAT